MSNFQRSRSKVWWGNSPPNIGSPIAQASNWNQNNQPREDDKDWEPQEPQWIGNNPSPDVNVNKSHENMSPKEVAVNPWPLRHGSPGSHKSQDSGFSDSDSSPPSSQYYPSPENNKSSSSSDSNNNENITVKQVIDFKDTPKPTKSLDVIDSASGVKNLTTSNTRLRSTSVIQTPYDFQKYIEVHGDEEHLELLKDSTEKIAQKECPRNEIKFTITPPENINNITVDKIPTNKPLVAKKKETNASRDIKVAKVKDLETSKTKSQDSLEYLQVSDVDHIAVNNQPRIRSPISTVPYEPEPDYDQEEYSIRRPVYCRSHSQQNDHYGKAELFQRNRLNKSLNYEGQRLDQQILNIQDGYHSLNYIDDDKSIQLKADEMELRPRSFKLRNVTDSLQLSKPHKKYGPKHKYKSTPKIKDVTCSFRLFPMKKEKPSVVDSHAGGIIKGSRVPELGLPRYIEHDEWVMVAHPEPEQLIHNERLIGSQSDVDLHSKLYETKDKSKAAEIKRIPPPPQFQDMEESRNSINNISNIGLTHDAKREKLKGSTESFNVHFNMECTSTPKMLAPHEFMYNIAATPQLPGKNTRVRRVNLLENFNENASQLRDTPDPPYQERSIDETPLERVSNRRPDSVQYWLCDLIGSCENECMTTLQSKALGSEVRALVSASSATITGNIKKVQTHGQIIVHQYSDVLRQIESGTAGVEEPLCLLVANVNEFVLTHSITLNTRPPGETPERWDRVRSSLQTYLQRLVEIGEDIKTELNDSNADWRVLQRHLASMLHIFQETTRAVLVQQLRTLVSIIEEPPSDIILKSTLTSVSHLGTPTNAVGHLHEKCHDLMKSVTALPFVDCAVPRALLTAVIETNKNSIKALSLRALATICVNGEAVQQFEEAGGMEIIADMLSDETLPEPAAREAVTVLAQSTATWRQGEPESLSRHLAGLLSNTTRILAKTECCQLLLLCTACLVNLVRAVELDGAPQTPGGGAEGTNSDRGDIVAVLLKNKTVERLLDAVKGRGPDVSVFLQEQTAAFLNMLSRSPRCLRHLSSVSVAMVALVCFTRVSRADCETLSERERGARARLLQHTTEAISRLCVFPEVATQIVQLEGIPRLIRLVRMQRARELPDSGSDDLLVYALKALRTINKHRPETFINQPQDVRDMVEGHLMQSIMKFSAKRESYV